MSATASPDRQHQTYAIFNARLRAEIRGLITPALLEEHRTNPLGRHSDALARVVNFLRRPPHYALYSAKPMREWQVIALPIAAGQPLSAEASFESRKRTYSYGAHAAHVAIDPDTGETAVLDYVAVEDVGRIINPLTLHGQTEGAVVQGLGGVFLEQVVYDDYGQPLTGSLTDYAMPRADHFPALHAVCLELKPSPNNPLGAKGAGEGGVIPTGGVIANAVSAALAPLGVSVRDLPLGAHALWRLIREARQGQVGQPPRTAPITIVSS